MASGHASAAPGRSASITLRNRAVTGVRGWVSTSCAGPSSMIAPPLLPAELLLNVEAEMSAVEKSRIAPPLKPAWLPEPVVNADPDEADPARKVDLDESVSMALLVVLESLSPAERSAFLLHDVFGYSFSEVAQIVGRTPAATRQLATRGRHAVEARRPRYPADVEEQRELMEELGFEVERSQLRPLGPSTFPAAGLVTRNGNQLASTSLRSR